MANQRKHVEQSPSTSVKRERTTEISKTNTKCKVAEMTEANMSGSRRKATMDTSRACKLMASKALRQNYSTNLATIKSFIRSTRLWV